MSSCEQEEDIPKDSSDTDSNLFSEHCKGFNEESKQESSEKVIAAKDNHGCNDSAQDLPPLGSQPGRLLESCDAFKFQHEFICLVDSEKEDDEDENDNNINSFNVDFQVIQPSQNCKDTCTESSSVDQGVKIIIENDKKYIREVLSHSVIDYNVTEASTATDNNCYFCVMPRELILKIFSYFSQVELCRHVLPVCKQWYDIGYDSTLWTELDFTHCPDLPSVELCQVIKRAMHLKKLVLTGRNDRLSTAEVAVFTQYCKWLQHLDLGFCDTLSKDMLMYFVNNCPNLERLNVEGCCTVNDDTIQILVKGKNLKHFNFSHCVIQDDGLILLAKKMEKIVTLNIDGISWITDAAIHTLISQHSGHLEWLELDGAELSNASVSCLTNCPKLRCLQISFCDSLTDQSLQVIQNFSSLTHLKLRKGVYLSNEGLKELFTSPKMSHLTFVDLSECTKFLDDGLISLTKCCGSSLNNLALSWCWNITDRGVISILDHCRKLEVLDIVGLDKITGECFYRIPEEMLCLKLLDLRQCNRIIDDLIVKVIRKKPDLTVFNYYGEKFIYD